MKAAKIQYTVMGDDGKEYGPVSADQIRMWIKEGRLERKTPVKPTSAPDWIFLGDIAEFGPAFALVLHRSSDTPSRSGPLMIILILVGLAVGVYFYFSQFKPH